MNSTDPFEARLESLGTFLQELPSLTERILQEVRQVEKTSGCEDGSPVRRDTLRQRRRWPWLAPIAAALGLALVWGLAFSPGSSVGWAEMSKAMRAQRWIHARNSAGQELWVAPVQKLWAFKINDDWIKFGDGNQRTKYEFRRSANRIVKSPLGDEGVARMLPLDDLSGDGAIVHPWLFGADKIVDQRRVEVTDDGRQWIEFELTVSPSVGPTYRGTLRIDPQTSLPMHFVTRHGADFAKSVAYEFDYPDRGPADIYDLGVPRDAAIDDRTPSNDTQRVLDAMAASRARIGDFRMVVFQSDAGPLRVLSGPMVVWRKGERWRVDQCAPERIDRGNGMGRFEPAEGQTWDEWLEPQLKRAWQVYLCDGKTVYRNSEPFNSGLINWQSAAAAPQDLLSGDRPALLFDSIQFVKQAYPDCSVPPGWTFEFDPRPADADGCVLIRISAEIAGGKQTAHEWYYIDPAKGHAVVRTEKFNLPVGRKPGALPAARQTVRLEEFQKSPAGFWYPTELRDSRPMTTNRGESVAETTLQYRFDFGAELPDSLFMIEPAE